MAKKQILKELKLAYPCSTCKWFVAEMSWEQIRDEYFPGGRSIVREIEKAFYNSSF